jgi:hypothetical protein
MARKRQIIVRLLTIQRFDSQIKRLAGMLVVALEPATGVLLHNHPKNCDLKSQVSSSHSVAA